MCRVGTLECTIWERVAQRQEEDLEEECVGEEEQKAMMEETKGKEQLGRISESKKVSVNRMRAG